MDGSYYVTVYLLICLNRSIYNKITREGSRVAILNRVSNQEGPLSADNRYNYLNSEYLLKSKIRIRLIRSVPYPILMLINRYIDDRNNRNHETLTINCKWTCMLNWADEVDREFPLSPTITRKTFGYSDADIFYDSDCNPVEMPPKKRGPGQTGKKTNTEEDASTDNTGASANNKPNESKKRKRPRKKKNADAAASATEATEDEGAMSERELRFANRQSRQPSPMPSTTTTTTTTTSTTTTPAQRLSTSGRPVLAEPSINPGPQVEPTMPTPSTSANFLPLLSL